ncbi:ATP-binding protein [Caldimonas tepidiphila]|uniref:ATP-binding protein n=1 Tax=Caldimonas tepidiphila TaxID=2315841 RepID=UPI000E5C1022|nr:ATP-binding protein [Caldimonas tepidiphila]
MKPPARLSRLLARPALARWPSASLRAYLVAVIVIATVPLAALTSYLIVDEVRTGRTQMEAALRGNAGSVAVAVEREIASSIDALTILSYSRELLAGDLAEFHRTLTSLPKLRPSWSSLSLIAPDGKVLLNTAEPYGGVSRENPRPPGFEGMNSHREPAVIGLSSEDEPAALSTGIQVPVVIGGELRYVLSAWIAPERWQDLVGDTPAPQGGFVTLFDADNRIIARSKSPDLYIGEALPPTTQRSMGRRPHGLHKTDVLEGGQAYVAFQRIEPGGWGVAVGRPAEPLDRAHFASIVTAVGAGLLSLAAGLLLALFAARRVTAPLARLAHAGPQAVGGKIEVTEIAALRDALLDAEAERRAAHERLQAKADEFETLFNNSPIGLAMAGDARSTQVLRNPALASVLAPPDAPPPRVFQGGREIAMHERPLQLAASEDRVLRDVELEVRQHDGRTQQLLVHAVPLHDAAGRSRGAIGAFVDITERKRAEARLIEADRRLRESQHLVELVQAAGHVGFFDYLFEFDQATWSSGMARLFGIGLDEFRGQWADWAGRMVPDDETAVRALLDAALARHEEQCTFEFRVAWPDGQVRWLAMRALLSYDEAGRAQRMLGVTVDVSDQKTVERERAAFAAREHAARIEAENANRAKDEFLAMLGHELRNPLGAITAATQALRHAAPPADASRRALELIARQTQHLAHLMDDLLDVSRAISGKIPLEREPLELAQAVRQLLQTLEMAGLLKSHRVTLRLQEAWVDADPTRLDQVINNLVTNAVKYTPAGGTIEVDVRAEGNTALLQVRDNGVGMPETLVPRVFDLFVQGERTLDRSQGGLGIGLTLVRRLVELHGGVVSAESPGPQQGSTFTVRLPRLAAAPPSRAHMQSLPLQAGARRVVIVEDNADALEALQMLLELGGHQVATAGDGEAGVQRILEQRPDIALVDIGLPGLDGYGVARRVREAGHRGRLVALTGYGQQRDIELALEAGFDAHLVKPIDMDALDRLLAQE